MNIRGFLYPKRGFVDPVSHVENQIALEVWLNDERRVFPVKTDTGDPSDPLEGQIYVNTSDNKVRVYADSAWRDLATW